MRLFVGIALEPQTKNGLHLAQQSMKPHIRSANFTRFDNFHVTLRFLGEIHPDDVDNIVEAMEEAAANCSPFNLSLGVPGDFKRGQTSLVWIGVQDGTKQLKRLSSLLESALVFRGIEARRNRFHAHVTLAREVMFSRASSLSDTVSLPFIKQSVDALTLFESKRTANGLEYLAQHTCSLKKTHAGKKD